MKKILNVEYVKNELSLSSPKEVGKWINLFEKYYDKT